MFCDIAINEDAEHFSVYEAIKSDLVKRGIPRDEICFAGDAKTDRARAEMFEQLRNGEKRFIIASTSKLGTGVNVQDKICAIHHLDIPWKPSDLTQQDGRGNQWVESKRIFTNDLGIPLHPSSVSRWFARFNHKNELRHIPLHSLRHKSASILVMNGVPLNAVSKRLGHACATTTSNIYAHVFRMADEIEPEALDNVIFKKTSQNHTA